MEKVLIFDTTLRDGEQAPGFSMNISEKVLMARQLEELKVDVIEPGFPATSEGDFKAVKEIAQIIKRCEVVGLARAKEKDIDIAWEAIKGAVNPRMKTVISTSDIHLKYQLHRSRTEVLEMAIKAVRRAKRYTPNVEFSAMDATRSNPKYLAKVFEAAIDAGATTVNISDTVGYALPSEFVLLMRYLKEKVNNIDRAMISVHCHNDLGLAVANSLSAIMNGARQVECTINGIGERAGNTSLEEIVMILKARRDALHFDVGVASPLLYPTSRLLTMITGVAVQPHKPIVGANVFDHKLDHHKDDLSKESLPVHI